MQNIKSIRQQLVDKYRAGDFAENNTVELLNASFVCDEDVIFGKVNEDYAKREIAWYESQSLNVNTIQPPIPQIWQQVSGFSGEINSNYGWCIFSQHNHFQFDNCVEALFKDKNTRQACMLYIRPSMHEEAFDEGMKDFMCTYATQVVIRQNKLHYFVMMRSNDAIFGFNNDHYWHKYVMEKLLKVVQQKYPEVEKGNLYWNAISLHVYPRHYKLLEEFN